MTTHGERIAEELIDVDEWCEEHGLSHSFPFAATMTPRLCAAIERIPFGLLRETNSTRRSADVFRRASAALSRALHGCAGLPLDDELELEFAVPLASSSCDPAWRILALHVGASRDRKPALTLDLRDV